ncbi:MAG: YggS family pyridoxal phosphate-dependent enzyme [Propionibacteriaceae bacterium]|jgi:pyridoxal phosphate enzyme (YggS family)|nr:YggS family pyridoxal phosphate-dependent enzyme [Propionibacteriaceae bacterium]
MAVIADNLARIRSRIESACTRVGRDSTEVELLPVSKTRSVVEISLAYAAGCRRFGENRVQEALAKAQALTATAVDWVIIGHLQSNKAKQVARFAAEFQALDSLELAVELDRRLQAQGRGLDVLIQVNTSAEASKSGLAPADVVAFAKALPVCSALRVRGLMTIALGSRERALVAPCFGSLLDLQRELRDLAPSGQSYDRLSMGMSGDFELAIEYGSTCVRIGEAVFGKRG